MTGKVYCDNCCEKVEFETKNEMLDVDINGMEFSYEAIVAYCNQCKNEVHIPKINDLNVIRAYKAQKEMLEKGC